MLEWGKDALRELRDPNTPLHWRKKLLSWFRSFQQAKRRRAADEERRTADEERRKAVEEHQKAQLEDLRRKVAAMRHPITADTIRQWATLRGFHEPSLAPPY